MTLHLERFAPWNVCSIFCYVDVSFFRNAVCWFLFCIFGQLNKSVYRHGATWMTCRRRPSVTKRSSIVRPLARHLSRAYVRDGWIGREMSIAR